jgi:crossover junction endodeoxyribonuclease RuvC
MVRGVVLGIDPGLDGALAILSADGKLLDVRPMPTRTLTKADGGKKRLVCEEGLAAYVRKWQPTVAWIEDVYSSSQMGVVGAFTFGEGKGTLRGVLGALGVPRRFVSPMTWKARLGVLVPRTPLLPGMTKKAHKAAHKKALKDAAIAKAAKLFPRHARQLTKDGPAEAALIGAYGLIVR